MKKKKYPDGGRVKKQPTESTSNKVPINDLSIPIRENRISADEDTQAFFHKMKNAVDERRYNALIEISKKYGFPKVSVNSTSDFPSHYNPITDRITIRGKNRPASQWDGIYVDELNHKIQKDRYTTVGMGVKWLAHDLPDYIKEASKEDYDPNMTHEQFKAWFENDPYEDPKALEYDAHKDIGHITGREWTNTINHKSMYGESQYPKIDTYENGGQIEMAKKGMKLNPEHKGWCTPMTKKTCTGKRRQFAINAKNHFKKGDNGLEMDPIDFSNQPEWLKKYKDTTSRPGFTDDNNLAPVTVTDRRQDIIRDNSIARQDATLPMVNSTMEGQPNMPLASFQNDEEKKKFDWGWLNGENLATGLAAIDALIPSKKQKRNYLTPADQQWTNPNPYGTGSTALMKNGGKAPNGTKMPPNKDVIYHPELYKPFGDGGQKAFDDGWMPETDAIDGVTTYKNRYNQAFNSVYIPGQKNKGNVALQGNSNGMFNVILRDGDGKVKQNLVESSNLDGVNDYFTNYHSTIANRMDNIHRNQPGSDVNISTQVATKDKKGGRMPNGGSLQVEDGQYKPLSQSFVQFNGPSHADGGIDIAWGNKAVEVEGRETGAITGNDNFTVFGNMTVPGSKMKFKIAGKKLANVEAKAGKQCATGQELIDENSPTNRFERLSYNAGVLKYKGGEIKKDDVHQKKEFLANLQQAMLDTAEQYNLDAEAMSNGEKKKAKKGNKMPDGGKLSRSDRNNNPGNIKYGPFAKKLGATGQDEGGFAIFPSRDQGSKAMKSLLTGKSYNQLSVTDAIHRWTANDPYDLSGLKGIDSKKISDLSSNELDKVLNYMAQGEGTKYGGTSGKTSMTNTTPVQTPAPSFDYSVPQIPDFAPPTGVYSPQAPTPAASTQGAPEYNWDFSTPESTPPSNVTKLRFEQYAPEIYAAATNRPSFVPAQKYTPQLFQPYQVSFQDRINENNQTFNALENTLSDNPAALSSLSAQLYNANSSVRGDEFRTNQGINNEITNKNVALQNDAQMRNLQILDTQYTRQEQSRANTHRDTQAILNSLSSKVLQHDYENKTLAAYENLSNYRMVDTNNDGIPDKSTYFGPDYTPPQVEASGTNYASPENTQDIQYRNYPESSVRYDQYGIPVTSTTKDNFRPTTRGLKKKKNGGNLQKQFNEKFGRK